MARFRGLIASASLKRVSGMTTSARLPMIPRLDCLGLIEAHHLLPPDHSQQSDSEA